MNLQSNALVITVNAYSRDESIEKCLNSIVRSIGGRAIPLIVVYQTGFVRVSEVIAKNAEFISRIIEVDGGERTPLENINHNRFLAYDMAFNELKADWVLAVEEDVILSKDAVAFTEFIIGEVSGHRFFRGINLGSREPFDERLFNTYSLLRYGLHGQASVIGKKTWRFIQKRRLSAKFSTHGFDSLIESHLKIGFMVTPNLSRSLDTGWDGTHMPSDRNDSYFKEMNESFVFEMDPPSNYFPLNILHRWREDLEIYRTYRTPQVIFRIKWYAFKHQIKGYIRSAA
jgi:hypothetical protein